MGDAVDRRVGIAVAVLLTSCWESGNPPLEQSYSEAHPCGRIANNFITLKRPGTRDDYNLWELTVHTPARTVVCRSGRGGWLCSDPYFDGRRVSGLAAPVAGVEDVRGLPTVSRIHASVPIDEAFSKWTCDVRRNGRLLVQGRKPVCDPARAECGDSELQYATLVIPEPVEPP